ncbi:unnamed protein product [Cylicocyclus nassatus]|uniref:Uncharacterized protein n=1 Tax=Cylicocyclus nassatus TaxID=53992 RepID=A0AA36M7J5_CYLNA|nr:unnamed protein product [Cylicocyclus nassatus]
MLQITEEEKRLWDSEESIREALVVFKGSADIGYTNENITSLRVHQSSQKNGIAFGSCIAASAEITMIIPKSVNTILNGQPIEIKAMARPRDNTQGTYRYLDIFSGYIGQLEIKDIGDQCSLKIVAYDWLTKGRSIDATSFLYTHADCNFTTFMDDFFSHFGLEKGNVNWGLPVELTMAADPNHVDYISATQLLEYACELNGCAGRIDPDGKFETVYINQNPNIVHTYSVYESFDNSDALEKYDGVIITNTDDLDYVTSEADDVVCGVRHYGACTHPYIVQANAFANGWTIRKTASAEVLYNAIKDLTHTPFTARHYSLPYVQCGDYVAYTNPYNPNVSEIVLVLERTFDLFMDEFRADTIKKVSGNATKSPETIMAITNNKVAMAGGGGGVTPADLEKKMDKANPEGNGSFSMNRKWGTTVGNISTTLGFNGTATGAKSFAEGDGTTAKGTGSHAMGTDTVAEGNYSLAQGGSTKAKGAYSFAGGYSTEAPYSSMMAIGKYNAPNEGDLFEVGNGTYSGKKNAFAVNENGTATAQTDFVAGSHKLTEKCSKTEVQQIVATEVSKLTFLEKRIATQSEIDEYIADPTKASFTVIYLLKDASAKGSDKYYEYQRIGDDTTSEFVMTGDTSTDLTDYAKKTELPTKTSDLTNDGDGTKPFLTEHQSLVDYAKKTDVPTKTSGVHIADISVGGTKTELYAPQGGGSDLPLSVVDGMLCITFEED